MTSHDRPDLVSDTGGGRRVPSQDDQDLPDLVGRSALITGAGRGIGRAVAADLARAGAHAVLVARSDVELQEAAFDIAKSDGVASTVTADVTDLWGFAQQVRRLAEEVNGFDILINNAGQVAPLGLTQHLKAADIVAALRLNVVTPIILSGAVLQDMRARGWGRIVNVSSRVVANPGSMVGGGVYAASKAALEAHTINLAAELADTGITVNVYRPGRVDTAMQEWIRSQDPGQVGGGLVEQFSAVKAAGDLITPEHSARALVRRLGSPESGRIWSVDDPAVQPRQVI